jgi:nitrite reductase/ring-hydroxylating ferredoxin subunit
VSGRRLCRLNDIPNGGSAGFSLPSPEEGEPLQVMAIRSGEQVYCYINVCPHWGAPLDISPGRFLDRDRRHILCSTHGALFRINDGRCIKGPCLGAALTQLRCHLDDAANVIVD